MDDRRVTVDDYDTGLVCFDCEKDLAIGDPCMERPVAFLDDSIVVELICIECGGLTE